MFTNLYRFNIRTYAVNYTIIMVLIKNYLYFTWIKVRIYLMFQNLKIIILYRIYFFFIEEKDDSIFSNIWNYHET